MQTLITEERLFKLGFCKSDMENRIAYERNLLLSDIKILVLYVILKKDNEYYLFIREEYKRSSKSSGSIICLKSNVRYIEQVETVYSALSEDS